MAECRVDMLSIEDSMKAASQQAESLSKNVKETVVLVREAVGV